MNNIQSKRRQSLFCLLALCVGLAQAQEVAAPTAAAASSAMMSQAQNVAVPALVATPSEAPTSAAQSPDNQSPAGIMKKVQGTVLVIGVNGAAPRVVIPGDAWFTGERLVTKADSGASLTLRDGSELVLAANTAVSLPKFEYDTTTQEGNILLDFLGGQLRILSGLIARNKSENMKIKTATALVGVRGTDFILEAPRSKDD